MIDLIKRIKNKIKNDQKLYYGVLIGMVLGVSFTVSAAILVAAKDVSLTSEKTDKGNVQDALDELYNLANSCITCSAGTYADNVSKQCIICTAGTYSEGNANTCTSCPNGYTSIEAATGEDKCYIDVEAGKWLSVAKDSTLESCPSGYYCPGAKVYYGNVGGKIECPSGYTSGAGATKEGDCYITTTAGKWIASANATTQTTCPAGSYCPSTNVYYGNTGGKESCPTNYTSVAGATKVGDCYITTTAGKWIASANATTQTNCTGGYYCPSATVYYGNTGKRDSCPTGYTSSSGATKEGDCYITTTAGKYIATAKSNTQTDCTSGYYCSSTNVYYGSTGGRSTCPSGYGSSAARSTQASNCYLTTTGGKYIATANSSTQTTCPAGSYCPAATVYYGSTGNIQSCGSNKTSPAGSSSSSACVSSSYTYTKTGSNGFTGTYTCENGTATITGCSYSGTYGSATCDAGSYGGSPTRMCTISTSINGYLNGNCNTSLPSGRVLGGGLPSTEPC